jgi:spectinomycin phosphotransferase
LLEKPDLPDENIAACVRDHYGLKVAEVTFLPLGFDPNTAVYCVVTADETQYFVKLRQRVFDETAALVPRFLRDQGIAQIMAPIATTDQQLWTTLDAFKLILYPYVEGRDGYEMELSERQWVDYGTALKGIHAAVLPPALSSRLPHETYTPQWRDMVKAFQAQVEDAVIDDPTSAELAAFLKAKRAQIRHLVGRAERLGLALQAHPLEWVLCHGDMHPGNLLIPPDGSLYIVDWDNLIFAPRERDLMFIGGDMGGLWHGLPQAPLFYQGYGQTQIDPIALAYYRYERIVQDIAAMCEQILSTVEGGEDREASLRILMNQFLPNQDVEIAYESEKFLPTGLRA